MGVQQISYVISRLTAFARPWWSCELRNFWLAARPFLFQLWYGRRGGVRHSYDVELLIPLPSASRYPQGRGIPLYRILNGVGLKLGSTVTDTESH